MRSTWFAGLLMSAIGAAGGAAPGQGITAETSRRVTFANVVDAAGEPLAGATVTFTGCLPHLGPDTGPSDVQVVQADQRGRAMARLQAGLCYLAWAVASPDAFGKGLLSQAHGYFGAGALMELVCEVPYAVRRIPVSGASAWAGCGPLQFFVVTAIPGTATEVTLVDGALDLPPAPQATLEVRTADGQPLWTTSVDVVELVIPPPQPLHVRVTDETGVPLPGALLTQRVGRRAAWRNDGFGGLAEERLRELGRTGPDGTVEVSVCYPADPLRQNHHGEMLLFASAPGRPPVAGGVFNNAFYVDDRRVAAPPEAVLSFTSRRVDPLVGNCGRVPAGTVAHLYAVCKLFSGTNSYVHDARAFTTPVAENGSFAFDGLPAELHCCRLTLLPPDGSKAVLPLFPAMAGRDLPPEVAVHLGGPPLAIEAVDLELQVTDPTGGPARGAVAYLLPKGASGVLVRDAVVRFPLDTRGVATLRLVAGTWMVLIVTNAGFCATVSELGPGPQRIELQMQSLASMRVRLRNGDGEPIAGARVQLRNTSTRGSGEPLQALLLSAQTATRTTWSLLETDADGVMTIPFVPVAGMTRRLALKWDGGMSADFELEAGTDPVELRPK